MPQGEGTKDGNTRKELNGEGGEKAETQTKRRRQQKRKREREKGCGQRNRNNCASSGKEKEREIRSERRLAAHEISKRKDDHNGGRMRRLVGLTTDAVGAPGRTSSVP